MNTLLDEKTIALTFPGLSEKAAAEHLKKYGENVIYHRKRLRPFVVFVKKFNSPLILLLIGAAIISFFFGQRINASVILVMVLMSVILDFVNSHKSEKVAEKLIAKVASTATVYRDGKKKEISLHKIVKGDVVELTAGDIVPADCFVLGADDFFVNQSALTGESFPVEKYANAKLTDTSLSLSDTQAIFMGTSVVTGYAVAQVAQTGVQTEFGKIAERLEAPEVNTSFDTGLKDFSFFIVRLTLVMVVIVFLINAYYGRGILNSFLFAAAIAVGLTPELLPVIMSVSLSHGSLVMSRKKVIVKNLASVQNFGSMDILCTDKTGTLTEDRIELVKCVDPVGAESKEVLLYAYLSSIFHTARKSPLDDAIQVHGKIDSSEYKKIDEIPFDFERRRDSIVVFYKGQRLMITKGAPESILSIVNSITTKEGNMNFNPEHKKTAQDEYDKLSADGFRVLAVAVKILKNKTQAKYEKQEETGMVFLGFAAFLDPPKQSAKTALEELRNLAVEVKIITGDSEILTERICRDLDIKIKGTLIGTTLDTISDEDLLSKLNTTTIFARVTPEQKERIVRILKASGHTVGYMGDGINDAPVLKTADVGISVNNAVDVAKETADIILLEKSLHVLKDGVIEGRKTFQNTLKYIKMGFSSNFGNMISMMGGSFFLPFFPMLSSQILLNNFLYDLSQTTIPSDNTDAESIKMPLRWNMREFSKYIVVFGVVGALFDFLTFYILYGVFHLGESHFQTGWFLTSFCSQVLVIFIIRTKRLPFWKSQPSLYIVASILVVVAIAWVIPFTSIGQFFFFKMLPPMLIPFIVGIVVTYLIMVEISKYIFYRIFTQAP